MLLATGSRDRLIHIFDVSDNYNHVHTIDHHSASITAVNFSSKNINVIIAEYMHMYM